MSLHPESQFVLFPLGEKRFALPAEQVAELARPDREQSFPHMTPLLTGVLVRRGAIVPVCDVAQVLVSNAPARKFYLIATRKFGATAELTAIPVTGECELASAQLLPPTSGLPEHVVGLLSLKDEILQVIDLSRIGGAESEA
ncbi:MAG: chemotaxis protein CheW [Terriglobia bacterium]|jgi:chemotaxis signal transduction protein|nr:chemotaxis protein CheW [Terriglobia bacterium]